MSQDRINTRARWPRWRSANSSPSYLLVRCNLPSRNFKAASDSKSYRAAAKVPVSTSTFSALGRTPPSPHFSLTSASRTPRLAGLGSLLSTLPRPGSSHLGLVLLTPELFGSAESISCFQPTSRCTLHTEGEIHEVLGRGGNMNHRAAGMPDAEPRHT